MLDDLSQAADEPITPGEEVAETTSESGSTQEQQQTEKPITRDDVLALLRETLPQAVMPMIQSQVAKGENRVNQRINERLAAFEMNKGVLNLSPEAELQAKRAIIEEEQMNAYAQPNPQEAQRGQAGTESNEVADPGVALHNLAQQAYGIGGVEVTPNDKEWAKIQAVLDDPQGNPQKFFAATLDASREKATRLNTNKTKAQGRVTSAGGAANAGDAPAKTSDDYWKKAHAKTN